MEENEWFYDKYKFIIFLVFGLILIGFIWWYWWNWLWEFWKNDQANLRWDAYGALNTLFSWLAFAWIIISILMQSEELKLQRKELKDTRNEFKTQSEVFKKDNFENTFFKLLEQKDIIRWTFQWWPNKWSEALEFLLNPTNNYILEWDPRNFFKTKYTPDINSNFDVYFDTLEITIELLLETIKDEDSRKLYGKLMKSRQSKSEEELIKIYYSSKRLNPELLDMMQKYWIINK